MNDILFSMKRENTSPAKFVAKTQGFQTVIGQLEELKKVTVTKEYVSF